MKALNMGEVGDPILSLAVCRLSRVVAVEGIFATVTKRVLIQGFTTSPRSSREEGGGFARLIGSLKAIRTRILRMEAVQPFANQQ